MIEKVTRSTTPGYYIGLDVHKSSIPIACAAADGSAPEFYGKTTGSNLSAERTLTKLRKKLGVDKGDLRICYDCRARRASPSRSHTAKPAPAG